LDIYRREKCLARVIIRVGLNKNGITIYKRKNGPLIINIGAIEKVMIGLNAQIFFNTKQLEQLFLLCSVEISNLPFPFRPFRRLCPICAVRDSSDQMTRNRFMPTVAVKIGPNVPLQGVSFCPLNSQEGSYFAVCGSRYISVCLAKPTGETVIAQTYEDEDPEVCCACSSVSLQCNFNVLGRILLLCMDQYC
jgi:hypothetical protein